MKRRWCAGAGGFGVVGGEAPQRLRIELLGPLRAWRDGTLLELGSVKAQALLAALLLGRWGRAGHERLLDAVWGTEAPLSGRNLLAIYVKQLRSRLDPENTPPAESVIRSGQGWYGFVADTAVLDVTDLEERAVEALRTRQNGDPATAADQLAAALALFRGEPLAGLPGPFADAERDRLAMRRRELRLARLECLMLLGRYADALDDFAAPSTADLLDESLAAYRMRALYGSGRQGDALRVFEEMRGRLEEELGVDPGPELAGVHLAVLRRDAGLLPRVHAAADERSRADRAADKLPHPRPAADQPPHLRRTVNQLPGDAGYLIGRKDALRLLTEPFPPESVAVLTVDGPAGVGKSALVVRAAREICTEYPDGCLFVDLRAHSTQRRQSPEQALQRLLRSLGAAKGELPADLDELTAAWRTATSGLRLLLVLDDALDADQIRPLLPAGAGSRVLVGSRRRLTELDADRRITLEPLTSADSVALLTHLIGAERANDDLEAVNRLAELCDGLPLALRIAGSRLQNRRSWPVRGQVDRMAGDEGRMEELTAGKRSVEANFRLSYDQHLTPSQQRAFRALGLVPTVEFDALMPAAMLGLPARATERILASLVDVSLLQEPRPGRYRLHDLVRVFARRVAEAVPEEAAVARRAALRVVLDAARTASDWGAVSFPTGPRPAEALFEDWRDAEAWLDAAGGELPDVVGHAVAYGEIDFACWIAEALCDYFTRQGRYHESQTALEITLARVTESTDARMATSLRGCLAYTAVYQRRYAQSRALFTEGLHLSRSRGDRLNESRALAGLGSVHVSVGEGDLAIAHVTAALDVSRPGNDHWASCMSLLILGRAHQYAGRDEEALAHYAEARVHAEAIGRPHQLGRILSIAADGHLRLGRHGEAKTLLRQALDLAEQSGDLFFCARSLTRLGTVEQAEGDLLAAMAFHGLALQRFELLSRIPAPGHDWLEMDIRTRLGHAYAAAGCLRAARDQFQRVVDVGDAR
ncbi:SARP family transcriptional regulator [Streptomyces sp. Y2F8-2]|nr:SARP family transcriptional regulator [Streptomyces sp. Y2F8-2]